MLARLGELRRGARAAVLVCAVVAMTALVAGCGGGGTVKPPKPGATLNTYVYAWSNANWAGMRMLVVHPPKDFVATNAAIFTDLGVSRATIIAGPAHTAKSGRTAHARITERYDIPHVGRLSISSRVELVLAKGAAQWRVKWSLATISPELHPGDKLVISSDWPARAPIRGAGGVKLSTAAQQVVVGVEGSRIKQAQAVLADLVAAGAPAAAARQAISAAQENPTYFEPVFTVSQARFEKLKAQRGPTNVYNVPGTVFRPSDHTQAITAQLSAHLVGTVGPITAEQLKQLGPPYSSASQVGQTGLQASYERTLAGTPTTHVDIDNAADELVTPLATFPGRSGRAVDTSIEPSVQRAAESALATATDHDVAMVAMKASTGQVIAAVSDPITTYNTAFQGAYPPGSTFKVLTSTALFRKGLSPSSAATCPTTLTIDGEVFHNAEGDAPVSDILQAFTESCNTAFIGLATKNLSPDDFTSVARLYGLQRTPKLGLTAFMDNIPKPTSRTELAGDAIGQGNVTFSPLGMATVAAAVDSGVVRAPRLVAGAPDDSIPTAKLPTSIVANLRTMMASVVASGTAAGEGLPAGTYAKTGTAEYGPGPNFKIDGWLMGYRGNVAFAIVSQNTGGADGGPVNGPIIARFLDAIG